MRRNIVHKEIAALPQFVLLFVGVPYQSLLTIQLFHSPVNNWHPAHRPKYTFISVECIFVPHKAAETE
jgi:hypothetical protein